jgi:hypothetical protein
MMVNRRGLFLGLAGLGIAPAAQAAGAPLAKDQVGYQDIPHNGKVCAQCVYFVFQPATSTGVNSRCKMVAGVIAPAGWCEIYAPKG